MNLDDYRNEGQARYARLAGTVSRILKVVLGDNPDVRVQQIQSRAKSVRSLQTKLSDRGVSEDGDIEVSVKDLAGCRIICYTNADVRRLVSSRIIGDNFDVDWDRTKFHYPPSDPTTNSLFISYNYVLKLKKDRIALPEYSEHRDIWCEVQVQTTLDHAWSEMAHDTIYKRLPSGFGSTLMKDVEARMGRIMQEYLRPAGFDFQKVANDVEKLQRGRALYENDPISVLNECKDNNERYSQLRDFKDYVLPYYDEVADVAPMVRDCVVSVAIAARTTPAIPLEYGFDGYTRHHILESALEVINKLRFVHEGAVEATFDTLIELWTANEMPDEAGLVIKSARQLTEYDFAIWQQVGPTVQQIVVKKIQKLPPDQIGSHRSIVIAMLDEVLKCEVGGATWNFDSVEIHSATVSASDALAETRHAAIHVLCSIFRSFKDDDVRREIMHAFSNATRIPSESTDNAELLEMLLRDTKDIVSFYREIADEISFELLQSLEHKLFWLYRHHGKRRNQHPVNAGAAELADEIGKAIIAFRNQINSDQHFVTYKTLVGFESVFPPMWDSEMEIEQQNRYRNARISELVGDVAVENAAEWLDIVTRCARTRSDDGATFSSFIGFLEELAAEKPDLALGFIANLDTDLARFLPSMLKGLVIGGRNHEVAKLTDEWLIARKHLPQIANFCSISPSFDADLLKRTISLAIGEDETDAVVLAMEAAARHGAAQDQLVENVFLPGVRYLASKRDTRWVRVIWPFARKSSIISSLPEADVEDILASLVAEVRVTRDVEWILAVIAKQWPTKVVDYFIDRLRLANRQDTTKDFDPVPFSLPELKDALADYATEIVQKLRDWYAEDDKLFQYRGATLATAVFPDFAPLETSFRSIVTEGDRQSIEFVVTVLRAFSGQVATQPVCREIVAVLKPDDELLNEVAIAIDSTGVVSGQFGFVEAYKRKKIEIQNWLLDHREPVRVFAESHIRSLDRAIAVGQRQAVEELEFRKRQYENLAEKSDTSEAPDVAQ